MYDDDRPVVITGHGWRNLQDGSAEFRVDCNTEVEFITLPRTLDFRKGGVYHIWGWLLDQKVAFYRLGKPPFKPGRWLNETFRTQEEMLEAVRYLM